MEAKILAELIAEVVTTGNSKSLSKEESSTFHQQFELEIAEEVEKIRSEKRRAYEELKNIAVR